MLTTDYRHVYFRINTPTYYGGQYIGFTTDEQRQQFFSEVTEVFTNDGWSVKPEKYNSSCPTVINGKQSLYLHPQHFSGVVSIDNIEHVEKLLSNAILFKWYKTDIYEDIYDLTDEQYLNYLEEKREEITCAILESYKTKRRNLYIKSYVPHSIIRNYEMGRIGNNCDGMSDSQMAYGFACSIFESLMADHKIISAPTRNGIGYRTATSKDNFKEEKG